VAWEALPRPNREEGNIVNCLDSIDYSCPEYGDLYDELPLWSAPFGLRLLDRVPIRPGLTILDVGAGTGFLTLELAQRCGSTSRVIAVDPWTAAMARLRRKLAHLGLDNVVLLEQDAAALDLPDSSVNVIVSNLGVNNFADVDAVMRELHRVAKPGAGLFLTTNPAGHMAEFYDVFRAALVELGQSDRLPALDAHIRHRGTVDTVTDTLAKAGFAVLSVETNSFRLRFADGTSFFRHHFIRVAFVQAWKSIVAPDKLQTTFKTLESNLIRVATRRGELAMTMPIACFEAISKGAETRTPEKTEG